MNHKDRLFMFNIPQTQQKGIQINRKHLKNQKRKDNMLDMRVTNVESEEWDVTDTNQPVDNVKIDTTASIATRHSD